MRVSPCGCSGRISPQIGFRSDLRRSVASTRVRVFDRQRTFGNVHNGRRSLIVVASQGRRSTIDDKLSNKAKNLLSKWNVDRNIPEIQQEYDEFLAEFIAKQRVLGKTDEILVLQDVLETFIDICLTLPEDHVVLDFRDAKFRFIFDRDLLVHFPKPMKVTLMNFTYEALGEVRVDTGKGELEFVNVTANDEYNGIDAFVVCGGRVVFRNCGVASKVLEVRNAFLTLQDSSVVAVTGGSVLRAMDSGKLSVKSCVIDHVRVECSDDGNVVMDQSKSSDGIRVKGRGSRLLATNCRLEGSQSHAIYVEDGASANLDECKIVQVAGVGLFVNGEGSLVKARRSTIAKCQQTGVEVWGEAYILMKACEVIRCKGDGLSFHNSTGVNCSKLENCQMLNNGGHGVYLNTGDAKSTVLILYKCKSHGSKTGYGLHCGQGGRAFVSIADGCFFKGNKMGATYDYLDGDDVVDEDDLLFDT